MHIPIFSIFINDLNGNDGADEGHQTPVLPCFYLSTPAPTPLQNKGGTVQSCLAVSGPIH